MKALIVEDNFTSSTILKIILGKYFKCEIANDGLEGISAFEKSLKQGEFYDIICLDIAMPKTNGQEVLKNIRQIENNLVDESYKQVKIIMTTALTDEKNINEALTQGASAYIKKPYNKSEIFHELKILELLN
jgi:two-component system, chemotaxis family, chemotaxis protein CheY